MQYSILSNIKINQEDKSPSRRNSFWENVCDMPVFNLSFNNFQNSFSNINSKKDLAILKRFCNARFL